MRGATKTLPGIRLLQKTFWILPPILLPPTKPIIAFNKNITASN